MVGDAGARIDNAIRSNSYGRGSAVGDPAGENDRRHTELQDVVRDFSDGASESSPIAGAVRITGNASISAEMS